MLKNELYTITTFENNAGAVAAGIRLNTAHPIFEGHFPGQPVLPGVCMMQIVKELAEEATGKKLFLGEAAQCKFLSMVDPGKTPELRATIDYKESGEAALAITAALKSETAVFFKMSATLAII
ncbi:hotdog family protein [Niabella drilacis]|uniref:3-hydroxyacyl-[acyl-carrier-protein] dehydratase n=1 Tax=Niabella drilacis (strain DSM 25811 / CCM 8410 / CCUG 62505 / LMG 26954 / E90) TaxID=1285928 RepID=A0A1G6Q741_NIADE|nr:3-hydroxyacyl-ACP dehydratase [Niabella drilacis]SDC88292.1 3-hydroxyacyl-[acyl-carrier-protein] dehydratase [Niabella drilacis]